MVYSIFYLDEGWTEQQKEITKDLAAKLEKTLVYFVDEETFNKIPGPVNSADNKIAHRIELFKFIPCELNDITWSDGSVTKKEDIDKDVILYDMQYDSETNMMKMFFAKEIKK